MIDSFANPNEIQDTNETFGVGDTDKIRFNAPENSFQTITVTGEAFDLKIITPGDLIYLEHLNYNVIPYSLHILFWL